ncbi:hypothetical protein GGR56DRAFT_77083 [Xylariaceae sp. FL0804]|nr:hypothetical protein GGR56DRAFT_77083 [Xylariaceae sp. FL0804]
MPTTRVRWWTWPRTSSNAASSGRCEHRPRAKSCVSILSKRCRSPDTGDTARHSLREVLELGGLLPGSPQADTRLGDTSSTVYTPDQVRCRRPHTIHFLPVLAIMVTFIVYAVVYGNLNSAVIFSSLAMFSLLRIPTN